jgi:hypothetical protein
MEKKLTSDMARYIWTVLAYQPYVTMSWGIDMDSIESDEKSVEFHVQGFLFTGNVRITYIEGADVFQVTLYDEEGILKETINDVYLSDLTNVIDRHVENNGDGNYKKKVGKWLTTI